MHYMIYITRITVNTCTATELDIHNCLAYACPPSLSMTMSKAFALLCLCFFSCFPARSLLSRTVLGTTPAVRRAPCRRPPHRACRAGLRRRVRQQILYGYLVPAGVTRQMEVGRRRWLVEAEVDEGDMTFLPVLNNGPVDERDEALHDRIRQSFEELMEEDERDEEVVTALERGLSPEMSREEGKVSLKREAKTHDLGS
jgi:hypothetical protein